MDGFNTGILNLTADLSQIGYGMGLVLSVLYFLRWRRKDPTWLLSLVSAVLTLESLATGMRLSYTWSVLSSYTFGLHWQSPIETIIRIPSVILAQSYFCWVAYCLLGRNRIFGFILVAVLMSEFAVAECAYVYLSVHRTSQVQKPQPMNDLFTATVISNVLVDTMLATSLIFKLGSLRSSLESSDRAIRLIVRRMIAYVVILNVLAILTLLLWFLKPQYKWYRLSFEALYRLYNINLLVALLSREQTRKLILEPITDQEIHLSSSRLDSYELSPFFRSRTGSAGLISNRRDLEKTAISSALSELDTTT